MLESAELNFNADHGYLEGLVRGCKAGLLTRRDYVNLVQCENLEGKRRSCAKSLSRVRLSATLWTIALQAPLSMGFSRQEYWSGEKRG